MDALSPSRSPLLICDHEPFLLAVSLVTSGDCGCPMYQAPGLVSVS